MAHFAKVLDGKVLNVIVAEQDFIDNFIDSSAGEWIQTSYNTFGGQHLQGGTPLRKNFAQIGGHYDADADAFYSIQPFPSWILNTDSYIWEAPIPMPNDDNYYYWNETDQQWVLIDG